MTVQEVADKLVERANLPFKLANTCDILAFGNSGQEVKGIVTSFMATADVVRKAANLGANMIVTHEPTWFSGADDIGWLENDPVYLEKTSLLKSYGISVWRYHDHMHFSKPDEIYEGITHELGWEEFRAKRIPMSEDFALSFRDYYDLPETTVCQLANHVKEKLHMAHVRIVGRPDMPCSRVGILVGGGSLGLGDEKMPMRTMEAHGIHVMICGDVIEWTLPAYVNDASQLGQKRALIVIGHERSEEWGMKSMASWLPELAGVPVTFVDAQEPYKYI
ncbi:MAG: Nif3-like dinuclear metal center hexameric protein [Clostridiales bacterium]|nr:Nif3-like dinuclear metal center hexameric protein [Clostridiales bacterium]